MSAHIFLFKIGLVFSREIIIIIILFSSQKFVISLMDFFPFIYVFLNCFQKTKTKICVLQQDIYANFCTKKEWLEGQEKVFKKGNRNKMKISVFAKVKKVPKMCENVIMQNFS